MQPDDERRRKTQQGIARARVLLKRDLGWLPGFPRVEADGALGTRSDDHVPSAMLPASLRRGREGGGEGAGESAAGLSWWSLPAGACSATVVALNREQLRRMEMTLTKLRHHFPRACPNSWRMSTTGSAAWMCCWRS